MSRRFWLTALIVCTGCTDETLGSDSSTYADASILPGDARVVDMGATQTDTGTPQDAGAEDLGSPDAGYALRPEPARDITIEELTINQAVEVRLLYQQQVVPPASRTAPLISERGGLVRAYWQVPDSFRPREIRAELEISVPGQAPIQYQDTKMISGPSSKEQLTGSFSFLVKKEDLPGGAQIQVKLWETTMSMAEQMPNAVPSQPLDLDLLTVPMFVDLVIVPTCGRAQLSSAEQQMVHNYLYNTYPVREVRLTFHEPISGVCNEDEAAFEAMPRLRREENAPPYRHYGGLVGASCGGRAMGLDASQRNAVRTFGWCNWRDVGPTQDLLAHELGHTHGRPHSFEDDSFPGAKNYPCGSRTSYGFGLLEGEMPMCHYSNDIAIGYDWVPMQALIPPTDSSNCQNNFGSFSDYMSYNYPYWVSSYTYRALAENIRLTSSWEGADYQKDTGMGYTLKVLLKDGRSYFHYQDGRNLTGEQLSQKAEYRPSPKDFNQSLSVYLSHQQADPPPGQLINLPHDPVFSIYFESIPRRGQLMLNYQGQSYSINLAR